VIGPRRLALLALAMLVCLGHAADAEPRRLALLIGAATGEAGEERLRFAEADAERIAQTLRDVGGFAAEDVVVLTTVSAAEVRRAIIGLNARLREVTGDSVLFVFYSGHADAEALQMAGTRLATSELRDLVYGSPATVRVLVIDACRSGAVTRTKGGRHGPAFAIDLDEHLRSKGVAILTSSAAGEDSQESDELRASYFTHYLASALRGAADKDADQRVTLVEAFTYASEHTLTATARTLTGPQHPTYCFDLTGREELILTRPIASGQRIGALTFDERGTYVVQQHDAGGAPIAEVEVGDAPRALALPAGSYFVTRRASNHLSQGAFTLVAARSTPVRDAAMEQIAYARVVRKGAVLARTTSVVATVGQKAGFSDLGRGTSVDAALRLDLPALFLEVRLGATAYGAKQPDNPKPIQSGRELGASIVGLRAVDLRHTTLAAGALVGGFWLERRPGIDLSQAGQHEQLGVIVGALGQLQHPIAGPVYARLELGALGYLTDPPADAPLRATVLWSLNLGVGAFF